MPRFVKIGNVWVSCDLLPKADSVASWDKGENVEVTFGGDGPSLTIQGTADEVAAAIEAALAGETPADTTPEPAAEAPVELRAGQVWQNDKVPGSPARISHAGNYAVEYTCNGIAYTRREDLFRDMFSTLVSDAPAPAPEPVDDGELRVGDVWGGDGVLKAEIIALHDSGVYYLLRTASNPAGIPNGCEYDYFYRAYPRLVSRGPAPDA